MRKTGRKVLAYGLAVAMMMSVSPWIVNTFSDNFFKGMFFKFFWC